MSQLGLFGEIPGAVSKGKTLMGLLSKLKGVRNVRANAAKAYDNFRMTPAQKATGVAPEPGIFSRLASGAKDLAWDNRSNLGRTITGLAVGIPSTILGANTILNRNDAQQYDPSKLPYLSPQQKQNEALQSQLALLKDAYAAPDYSGLEKFYAQLATSGMEDANKLASQMSGGVNPQNVKNALNQIYTTQAGNAADSASASTGTETSGLVPVSGSLATTPDTMGQAGNLMAQYLADVTAGANAGIGAQKGQLNSMAQDMAKQLGVQLMSKMLDSSMANDAAYKQAAATLTAQSMKNASSMPTAYTAPDKTKYASMANNFTQIPANQQDAVIASVATPAQQLKAKQLGLSNAELYAAVQLGYM